MSKSIFSPDREKGPEGPTGPGFTIRDQGNGSVLVVNPDNKDEIFYNQNLNIDNERILCGKNINSLYIKQL